MDDLDLGSTIKGFSPGQKVFTRYTLGRILGRGGMGVVWLARDEELGRETALKFLPEVVAADRSAVEDMKREVRRAIDLAHPHIVKIHDFITDGRTAAVSMEYISGSTLAALRQDKPGQVFSIEELNVWAKQLCNALDHAHQDAQVVHRDLKPANLMVDARGRLKVLDFGIAASISDSVSRISQQAGSSGTPVYMSPQQMMGEDPAVTDDIYALGATLYELLTGKPPFHSGNIILQVQNKVPARVNERRKLQNLDPIPANWDETIAACLEKDAALRPRSAGDLLERLITGVTPPATPVTPPPPGAKLAEAGNMPPPATNAGRRDRWLLASLGMLAIPPVLTFLPKPTDMVFSASLPVVALAGLAYTGWRNAGDSSGGRAARRPDWIFVIQALVIAGAITVLVWRDLQLITFNRSGGDSAYSIELMRECLYFLGWCLATFGFQMAAMPRQRGSWVIAGAGVVILGVGYRYGWHWIDSWAFGVGSQPQMAYYGFPELETPTVATFLLALGLSVISALAFRAGERNNRRELGFLVGGAISGTVAVGSAKSLRPFIDSTVGEGYLQNLFPVWITLLIVSFGVFLTCLLISRKTAPGETRRVSGPVS